MSRFSEEIVYNGCNVTVEGEYHKAHIGAWAGGVKMEPDEPEEFEVETVLFQGVDIFDILDERAIEAIETILKERE